MKKYIKISLIVLIVGWVGLVITFSLSNLISETTRLVILVITFFFLLIGSLASFLWINDKKYWMTLEEMEKSKHEFDKLFVEGNAIYNTNKLFIEALGRLALKKVGITKEEIEKQINIIKKDS